MSIKTFKPTTPSRRQMTVSGFDGIDKKARPEPSLTEPLKKSSDRNSYGRITVRHRGNALPIANIPVGTVIHNIELHPGNGAQLVRAAGTSAQLMAKEGDDAQIRMPSGEVRIVRTNCYATIGQVGNIEHENINIGKAGRKRHMGWRPTVRGSVMNPNDHPHGGGEGRAPVGRSGPVTPWGKPALGYKTRKGKNPTSKFIVKRRNEK